MDEKKKDALATKENLKPMPVDRDFEFGITPEEAKKKLDGIKLFQAVVQKELQEGLDYGIIPGTGDKPTLLKPGAEKITKLLNCFDSYEEMDSVERWDDKDAFFQYKIRCILSDITTGLAISSGIGSCNSKEARYRYRWVPVWDLTPAQEAIKDEMPSQKRGKGERKYLFYRFENDDPFSLVNTIMKQAAKRALIAAALSAGRLSNIFSQDLEDVPISKAPDEQASEPITKEQIHTIARFENILTDDFGLMPEVMQMRFRAEYGTSKEIKDITHPEAVEWMEILESRIERELKKKKAITEDKEKKTGEKKEDAKDIKPFKDELKFVMKQYRDHGGKELDQKEIDELDRVETLVEYKALIDKWKPRRDAIMPKDEKDSK